MPAEFLTIHDKPSNCSFQFAFPSSGVWELVEEVTEIHPEVELSFAKGEDSFYRLDLAPMETVFLDYSESGVVKCTGSFGYCMLWIISALLGPTLSGYAFETQPSSEELLELCETLLRKDFVHDIEVKYSLIPLVGVARRLCYSAQSLDYEHCRMILLDCYKDLAGEYSSMLKYFPEYEYKLNIWKKDLKTLEQPIWNCLYPDLDQYRHTIIRGILKFLQHLSTFLSIVSHVNVSTEYDVVELHESQVDVLVFSKYVANDLMRDLYRLSRLDFIDNGIIAIDMALRAGVGNQRYTVVKIANGKILPKSVYYTKYIDKQVAAASKAYWSSHPELLTSPTLAATRKQAILS